MKAIIREDTAQPLLYPGKGNERRQKTALGGFTYLILFSKLSK